MSVDTTYQPKDLPDAIQHVFNETKKQNGITLAEESQLNWAHVITQIEAAKPSGLKIKSFERVGTGTSVGAASTFNWGALVQGIVSILGSFGIGGVWVTAFQAISAVITALFPPATPAAA